MLYLNTCDIVIITVKGVDYCCIIREISKSEVIQFLENSVLEDRGCRKKMLINIKNRVNNHSDKLTTQQQTEIKNILINEKNFKDMMIFLNR